MKEAPFGAWESPVTASAVTRVALRFSDSLEVDGGDLYWAESRPAEGGRTVLVRRAADGAISDVTPPGCDARTRVHEYGGGASHFGVADLELLAGDTHKFESRYLDWLVGPYPEAAEAYRARSPIHHLEGIDRPVILFQGLEDRVVPPQQAEIMAAALRARGVPVAHLTFPGEGHGFRRAENIARTLEAELSFYGRVFGFTPAGGSAPITVEGL